MNIVPTPPTNARTARSSGAFTLIELMVVISIMAILAALVVGLARRASDHKRLARVQAELSKWTTLIDAYQNKLGFYPPGNPDNPYGPAVHPLFYELAGASINDANQTYTTYTTGYTNGETIAKSLVTQVFGLDGLANAASEKGEAVSFGKNIQAGDVISVKYDTWDGPVTLPRVSVPGPPPYGTVNNVWHYDSKHPTHNTNSYDLWAEILVGGKTNIIGNWKR
ncbi:MAG: type II secretion system protein [Verrucomicrobia bacterium]|nr:type II secretion system protein [Verrucomicrobiota bacterium]